MGSKQKSDVTTSGLIIKSFRRFGHHLRPFSRLLLFGMVCLIAVTLLQLIKPWPIKMIFDGLLIPAENFWVYRIAPELQQRPEMFLAIAALAILGVAILIALFGFAHNYIFKSVGQRMLASIRAQFYAHVQRLPHSFHDMNQSGDLLVRLTGDIRTLREILVTSMVFVAEHGLYLVGMLAVVFWMDWQLALISIVVLPPLAICCRIFATRIRNVARLQRGREGKIASRVNERIGAIKLVQAFARESHEDECYKREEKASLEAGLRAIWLEAHLGRIAEVVLAAGTCAVVWFGVTRVQSGAITAGDLLVFVSYLKTMHKPIRKISEMTGKFARIGACAERILAIFDVRSDDRDTPGAIPAERLHGSISFDSVSFAYPGGKPILDNISFDIRAGEHVAVVGASGAGKSTLANLLLRFYEPEQGSIRIDGLDIESYTRASLREQMAIVLQESVLFNASIRENIAYGRTDACEFDIVCAAAVADARGFIAEFDDGLDTVVGERGKSLSGGQRQRIAIARAVVRDAPILILDEPLSGLDPQSRSVVRGALERLRDGRSTLHITHDMDSAARADRVLVLEDGRVVAFDRHETLLKTCRSYSRLWNSRYQVVSGFTASKVAV